MTDVGEFFNPFTVIEPIVGLRTRDYSRNGINCPFKVTSRLVNHTKRKLTRSLERRGGGSLPVALSSQLILFQLRANKIVVFIVIIHRVNNLIDYKTLKLKGKGS